MSHRVVLRKVLPTLLVLPFIATAAGCGSATEHRYVDVQPSFDAPSERFEGAMTSIDPPYAERTDGGRSWGPYRTVFHSSQRATVEQLRLGDRVRATAL